MGDSRVVEWIVIVALVLVLVAMLAWVRGFPGADGRAPDPAAAVVPPAAGSER